VSCDKRKGGSTGNQKKNLAFRRVICSDRAVKMEKKGGREAAQVEERTKGSPKRTASCPELEWLLTQKGGGLLGQTGAGFGGGWFGGPLGTSDRSRDKVEAEGDSTRKRERGIQQVGRHGVVRYLSLGKK